MFGFIDDEVLDSVEANARQGQQFYSAQLILDMVHEIRCLRGDIEYRRNLKRESLARYRTRKGKPPMTQEQRAESARKRINQLRAQGKLKGTANT